MQSKMSGMIAVFFIAAAMSIIIFGSSPEMTPQTAVAGGVTPTMDSFIPLMVKPAATPTATTPPADVQITLIVYNPNGDDVAGEYVRIENKGGTTAVLTGWTLSDNDTHVYDFPSFSLAPGAAVLVWVKSGTDNATNLYWGSAQAYWNNTGDTAFLRDGGTLVDSCSYGGGGVSANC